MTGALSTASRKVVSMTTRMLACVSLAAVAAASFAEVKEPSIRPSWSGASVCEWTMDYQSALSQARDEGRWTLMLFTGAWWCPWCQPLEEKVLDTDEWRAYAAQKSLYEVEMDYPARDGVSRWCWLWETNYLATAGLTPEQGAAEVFDRYMVQDAYALPDATTNTVEVEGHEPVSYRRIDYPTILVIAPNGDIAGRFSPDVRDYPSQTPAIYWSNAEALAFVTNQVSSIMASNRYVNVSVDPDSYGRGTVSAVDGIFAPGATIALKATAAKGYVFGGWYVNGAEAEGLSTDFRQAASSYTVVDEDASITARFVSAEEDMLSFDFTGILMDLEPGVGVSIELGDYVSSASTPTITAQGLPAGLKLDGKTMTVSGTPTTPGTFLVTFSGKNASGYSFSQIVDASIGNIEGSRISGGDVDVSVGDFVQLGLDELFTIDADGYDSIAITGLPTGLRWDPAWEEVSGIASKAGEFVVKAVVKFPASGEMAAGSETATLLFSVLGPDPDDYGVDFTSLEGLAVGDLVSADNSEIGTYVSKCGLTSISGLPTGLKTVTWTDDEGVKHYGVEGMPTKAGKFVVKANVSEYDEDTKKTTVVALERTVVVASSPSLYVGVTLDDRSDPVSGTVKGGGILEPGAKATIAASAKPGFVFAGWFDGKGEPLDLADIDYRTVSVSQTVTAGMDTEWHALFVAKADDAEIAIDGLDGASFDLDAELVMDEQFAVDSVSLPTLTFKGLPSGVKCIGANGEYSLSYDPATVKNPPAPGVYSVTATAKNLSGAAVSSSFSIKVANWRDDSINVLDDYGDFAPGIEIEPIDLADAIRYADGETMTVKGLPAGLKWNTKADAAKGIAAYTITGIPTKPGSYTITWTAKVVSSVTTNASGRVAVAYGTAVATSTITVEDFPALVLEIDEDAAAAGNVVSGAGNFIANKKVSLKATAAKGWVFAGWDGVDGNELSLLNPSISIVKGVDDETYGAEFIRVSEDWLYVDKYFDDDPGCVGDAATLKLTQGSDVGPATNAIAKLVDTGSLPTISVSGLPAGLKFDAKTFMLSGKPTKAGVYYATVAVKNAGGYKFTRVIRMAVYAADGTEPEEAKEEDTACVDLSELDFLVTGEPTEMYVVVPRSADGDSDVKSVSVTGLPKGLASGVLLDEDGTATVAISGVPSVAGRSTVKFMVTYKNNKKANTVRSVIVEDGGSAYLFVVSADNALGTVTGEGVYAAGETVKLTAKAGKNCVFAGWWADAYVDPETSEVVAAPFAYVAADYRTPGISFQMVTDLMDTTIVGDFVATADDSEIEFDVMDDEWRISPDESSEFGINVLSVSLPSVTVSGLPKGVSFDKAANRLVYSVADRSKLVPGVYPVVINAQNVSKKKADAVCVNVHVPIPENAFFTGYGLDQDEGYEVNAGVPIEDALVELGDVYNALVKSGLKITFKNLPAGISVVSTESGYAFAGVPTKAGVYTVVMSATGSVAGEKVNESGMFFLSVEPLPEMLVGTFNGCVSMVDPYDDDARSVSVGSLSFVGASTGRLSAKVVRPTGTFSFSAASWDEVSPEAGYAKVAFCDAAGRLLYVTVDLTAGMDEQQLSGYLYEDELTGKVFDCLAQYNAFAAGDAEMLSYAAAVKGAYAFALHGEEEAPNGQLYSYEYSPTASAANKKLTVSVDATGTVKFAGKYGAKSISGSTVLCVESGGEGAMALKAELVVKQDAEHVAIASIAFVRDTEGAMWRMASIDDAGLVPGATIEVYKSDCASCAP